MKDRLVPLLGIAFVVALIATGVFYGLFVGRLRSAPAAQSQPVVVATHKLETGTVLKAADVEVQIMSESPGGSFSAVNQVAGFTVLQPVEAGEAVVEGKLATHRSIPAGLRAVSIHATDSSGVVEMLRPGNRVDVQLVATNTGQQMLRTLLQNVEVLAIAAPDGGRPVVNLLVTPEQAEIAGLADSTGRLRLTLRNGSDAGVPTPNVISSDTLLRPVKSTR